MLFGDPKSRRTLKMKQRNPKVYIGETPKLTARLGEHPKRKAMI